MANMNSTPLSRIGNVHSSSPSNSLIVVVEFDQSTRNFAIDVESTLKCLKERISSKWPNKLSSSLFDLSFEFEGKSKVVDSDFDLQSLVFFAMGKQIQFVRFSVILCTSGNVSDVGATSSHSSSIFSNVETIVPYVSHTKEPVLTHVGQMFVGGAPDFRLMLLKHCLLNGFDVTMVKNEPHRITAECVHKVKSGCQWRVHASKKHKRGDTFFIKKFHSCHTCGAGLKQVHYPIMSSKLVHHIVSDMVEARPSIKPKEIITHFRGKYGVELSYYYAFKGKELSLIDIHGDDSLSYHQLVWYIDQLRRSNPGSVCVLEKDEVTLKFQRVFISFGASIQGFHFCRPLVFLDATHLTGKSKGVLLAATGKNGNQGIFQLAIGIVDTENIENWIWFLEQLKKCIEDRKVIFISDRHPGLIRSVSQVFPRYFHSHCYWHLERNLLSKIPKNAEKRDDAMKLFKVMAHANTVSEYEVALSEFKKIASSKAISFVDSLSVSTWTNAFFPGVRYGETSSALAESFNSWILEERGLPITALLDCVRMKIMCMYNDRRQASSLWSTTICPRWEEEIDARIEHGKYWQVMKSSKDCFEILAGRHQRVNLLEKKCSCNAWKVEGFPCVHALRCINSDGRNVYDFCEHYFHTSVYRQAYARGIEPVCSVDMPMEIVDKALMLPPDIVKLPGRPRVKRIGSYRQSKRKGDTMPPKAYGRRRAKKAKVCSSNNSCDADSGLTECNVVESAQSENYLPIDEIAEFPLADSGVIPLADFHPADYVAVSAVDDSAPAFAYSAVSLLNQMIGSCS